jgi:hypothetical protein
VFRFKNVLALIHTFIITGLKELRHELATSHTLYLALGQGLFRTPGYTAVLLIDKFLEALPILQMHALNLHGAPALLVDRYCRD